jgi:glutamate synthase domain-containing protein 3
LTIRRNPLDYRENYNWRPEVIEDIIKQAETGGVLLTGMGDDKGQRIYWDHLVLVIGGTAQDFLGEYMAGGILILLGLNLSEGEHHKARFIGTGMHGGVIYLRGSVDNYQLGKEVGVTELKEEDFDILQKFVGEFSTHFGYEANEILRHTFIKLFPRWLRPYGRLYAY